MACGLHYPSGPCDGGGVRRQPRNFRDGQSDRQLPFWLFVTVPGPGETDYPEAGDNPTVYYAQFLGQVSFEKSAGNHALDSPTLNPSDFVYYALDYLESGTVVACARHSDRWYVLRIVTEQFDTPWCGNQARKLYLTSGEFSSTLKDSESVLSVLPIGNIPVGIAFDGENTPWGGTPNCKLYLQSGQFSSTIKTSLSVSSIDTFLHSVSYDGSDTLISSITQRRLRVLSGQFTTTVKASQSVGSIDAAPFGVSFDGVDTPWCGGFDDKLYLQSGKFSSTLKTSVYVGSFETNATGISFDGLHTPWCGSDTSKLYLTEGQFTSTLLTSVDVGSIDTGPEDIDFNGRL